MLKYFFLIPCILGAQTFNNQMSLSDFGSLPNPNTLLQTSSRYTSFTPLRTNDFQSLQLNFGDYATGRYPCRWGPFLVSISVEDNEGISFGPQYQVASYTFSGDQGSGIRPNQNLLLASDPNWLKFGFLNPTGTLNTILDFPDYPAQFQDMSLFFSSTSSSSTMSQSLVQGDPYAEVEYQNATPVLQFGSGILTGLEVDSTEVVLPFVGSSFTLPQGTKFRLQFANPVGTPQQEQIWLIYIQQNLVSIDMQFEMGYTLTLDNRITNVSLQATSLIDNALIRAAVIQSTPPISEANTLTQRESPNWQLVAETQARPYTPLSFFLLWPNAWAQKVGTELVNNQNSGIYLSSCQTNSILIPLLACSNSDEAYCWYVQLIDKMNKGQQVFEQTTNSFVCEMNMLVSKYYMGDQGGFQSASYSPATSSPNNSISPSSSAIEQMFDDHRSVVPTSSILDFTPSGNLGFLYEASTETFPAGAATSPLIIFPGYNALASGLSPIGNALFKDPIFGDLAYVEAGVDTNGDFFTAFNHAFTPPSWATRVMPDDLWFRINTDEKVDLSIQLQNALSLPLPGLQVGVLDQGRALFQAAMTLQYGLYVLMAEQNFFPAFTAGSIPDTVKNQLQPYIDYIEEILEAWLITREYQSTVLSNYFIGDSTANGIVAFQGTTSPSAGTADQGNAVYSSHNYQYGYFLFAAAIAIQMDQLFGNTPWIAQLQTKVSTTAITKEFLDVLWRDYCNPVSDDTSFQYNRHQNDWAGLSCGAGVPAGSVIQGQVSRNLESISEAFMGYLGPWMYAVAIQNSNALDADDQEGFDLLQLFCQTHMQMLGTAGQSLFYNTGNWVFNSTPFNFNRTAGTLWDNQATMNTTQPLGTPPCALSHEGCVYSRYRLEVFTQGVIDFFNAGCECSSEGKCKCKH